MSFFLKKRSVTLLSLSVMIAFSQAAEEPYPANPVNMQFFRNDTVPNVGIIVDNTATMKERIIRRHNVLPNGMGKFKRMPRRLDVVKDAALTIVDKYHAQFNWALFVINDRDRDMHWDYSDVLSGSGFIEVPGRLSTATFDYPYNRSGKTKYLAYATGMRAVRDHQDKGSFKTFTYQEDGVTKTIKDLLGVEMNEQSFGYLTNRKGKRYDEISSNRSEFDAATSVRWARGQGHQVLVPLGDNLDPTFDADTHKKQMIVGLKTIAPYTGVLQSVYGQAMEYMADKVEYRCQDSFMIILTDGNIITNGYNSRAAKKYAHQTHPRKSTERDKDGQYFNGEDFPDQRIRSYAIGIGTNQNKFKQFEKFGKGRAVTANDSEEILELMEEFVADMRPTNKFYTVTPATSYLLNDSESLLQGNIISNGNDWSSSISFKYLNDNSTELKARYFVKDTKKTSDDFKDENGRLDKEAYEEFKRYNALAEKHEAVVYANTPTGLLNYSQLGKTDSMISWLIGGRIGDQEDSQNRVRTVQLDGEKRFLGDTFSDMFGMIGERDPIIQAPKYLVLGSNDGVFKIYQPNPLYGEVYLDIDDEGNQQTIVDQSPYAYAFGYIPAASLKNNGKNILDTMKIRADRNYGKPLITAPEHQYTMNGSMMYRTTDQGQTFVVGTLGQGGRGAFALNIGGNDHVDSYRKVGLDANKESWGRTVPLWDTSRNNPGNAHSTIDGGLNNDRDTRKMGYITSAPTVGRIALERVNGIPKLDKDVRYIAALPTGNHGDDAGPTLYLYDALGTNVALNQNYNIERETGRLLKKITYLDSALKYKSSLSGVTLLDLDFDGVIDVGYGGDRNGNLYRFDFRGNTPNDWSVHLLYKGSVDQPIKSKPVVSRYGGRTVVVFGTGSQVYDVDYSNPPQQAIYGIIDNLMGTVSYEKEDLIEQILTDNYPANGKERADKRYVTNHKVSDNSAGWFINLSKNENEMVFGPPEVFFGTIFFRTHVIDNDDEPDNDWMCFRSMTGPSSWIMQVNARTGGALTDKDTYITSFGPDIAGKRQDGFISSGNILVVGDSSSMSYDGEMKSGSEKDGALSPENSSTVPKDPNYKIDEDTRVLYPGGGNLDDELDITFAKGDSLMPRRMYLKSIY